MSGENENLTQLSGPLRSFGFFVCLNAVFAWPAGLAAVSTGFNAFSMGTVFFFLVVVAFIFKKAEPNILIF